MIALPLALSLSSSFTDAGAIAAFAALLGIAILSLLAFSQAREIKRLREWAGRAPERALEMEQRVSAEAAARVQRGSTAVAPARVVPRATPLVSAPVSTAVNATVAAVVPPATGATSSPLQGTPSPAGESAAPELDEQPPAAAPVPAAGVAQSPMSAEGSDAFAVDEAEQGAALGAPALDSQESPAHLSDDAVEPSAPAPATAAARAARPPLPPSPADPAPPTGVPSGSVQSALPAAARSAAAPSAAAASASAPAAPSTPAAAPAMPASRPPAPVAAARRTPSRAVAASAASPPPRSPAPPRARAMPASAGSSAAGRVAASSRAAGAAAIGSGPKYFKPERSPRRAGALIAGGVVVGALLIVFAVSALKGGGGSTRSTPTQSAPALEVQRSNSHTSSRPTASNPAEVSVAVLNGTGTAGLAHHLAGDLQQSGYARAAALAGEPPGTHSTTVVQYAHGHRADAQAVAKALNVTQVQALESSIAPLAGAASVVVLAGADQAAQLGGGGAQSNGEPAAGSGQ